MHLPRSVVPLLLALAICTGFIACRRPLDIDQARAEGMLLVGTGPEPEYLDPQLATTTNALSVNLALWEGLVAPGPDLAVRPGVAERWEISDDGLTYTFHLRDNARWSNGKPITAEDFRYAWQRLLTPAVAAGNAAMLHVIAGAEAFHAGETNDFSTVGVTAPDARTLVVRLAHPTPYLLELLMHPSFAPLPQAVVSASGEAFARQDAWARPGKIVSNGPFMLSEWRHNERLSVVRNPHYWNHEQVKLNGVRFFPITDLTAEERAFLAGQLHVTEALPPRRVPHYRKTQPEVLRVDPYLGTYYYLLNHNVKPLDDVRVRQALSAAIDRESIADLILQGGQQPAYQFTPPSFFEHPAPTLPVDEGRRLLAEAGFPDGQGFPVLELVYNASEAHQRIAESIQNMWQRAYGIEVRLSSMELKTYLERRRLGDFAIARAVWIGDYLDPQTFLELWTHDHSNNYSHWSSPAYDAAIAQAQAERDPDARRAAFVRAETILQEQAVILPIYHYTTAYLLRPEVQGWEANLLDWHPYQYLSLEKPE